MTGQNGERSVSWTARVAAAMRQIMAETVRREPRGGRNVLMLAWFADELGTTPPDPDDFDIMSNAAVAYAERRDGWEQVVEALGIAVTTAISPVMPEEEPQGADDALAVNLAEIAAHPESVSLADLAARYSYSAPHLSELIHERCGRTFTELVREQRMERAAMLLRATGLPVAEVARRVGYAGTSNFNRAFRERFGRSPSELRADARPSR